jgi:phosphoglycolate phosphatase
LPPSRLVLFDIDGTLLWPDRIGRASLKEGLEAVYGTSGNVETYSLGGSLDKQTVRILMSEAGIDEATIWERFDALGQAMEASLRERIAAKLHNVRALPGGIELVNALHQHEEVLLGLVTGNFRNTALLKLEAAGYGTSMFQVGAFGHEAEERAALPPIAVQRAREMSGIDFCDHQIVIIGDTPADVECAQSVNARTIAVLTGWSSREALIGTNPHYLFDDLSDTAAVLQAIFAPL